MLKGTVTFLVDSQIYGEKHLSEEIGGAVG